MELNRHELKNQALLEKISNMTAQYENQIADLRVALTIAEAEKEQANDSDEQSADQRNARD